MNNVTDKQTRKKSRVPEWQEMAIHAKVTSFQTGILNVGLVSNDAEFIAECWEVLNKHFYGYDEKCDTSRIQDVVVFKSDMVEVCDE